MKVRKVKKVSTLFGKKLIGNAYSRSFKQTLEIKKIGNFNLHGYVVNLYNIKVVWEQLESPPNYSLKQYNNLVQVWLATSTAEFDILYS